MAIRLRVRENVVHFGVHGGESISLSASTGIPIYPEAYTGATEVTPSEEVQTLSTKGLSLLSDITINPIPNNYGLITWDGTGLRIT